MGDFKRGSLNSGKKGPKVQSPQQAKAIAASICNNSEEQMEKHKFSLMQMGYSEEAVDAVLFEYKQQGLWDNIHAKRKRIKQGSGERMRSPGDKDAPSAKDLKDAGKDKK